MTASYCVTLKRGEETKRSLRFEGKTFTRKGQGRGWDMYVQRGDLRQACSDGCFEMMIEMQMRKLPAEENEQSHTHGVLGLFGENPGAGGSKHGKKMMSASLLGEAQGESESKYMSEEMFFRQCRRENKEANLAHTQNSRGTEGAIASQLKMGVNGCRVPRKDGAGSVVKGLGKIADGSRLMWRPPMHRTSGQR